MSKPKVFCIGLYKTGTMSLGRALIQLGYNVCPASAVRAQKRTVPAGAPSSDLFSAVAEVAERYNGFRNDPWYKVYRECAEAYPDAKFILTERRAETWIPSVLKHFGTRARSEAEYRQIYADHAANVRDCFAAQPDRLLIIDIEQIDWPPVCKFLGHRVPLFRVFPHRNQTRNRSKSHLYKVFDYEIGEVARGIKRRLTG